MKVQPFEIVLAIAGQRIIYLMDLDPFRLVESIFRIVIEHYADENTNEPALKCGCYTLKLWTEVEVLEVKSEGQDYIETCQIEYFFGKESPLIINQTNLNHFLSPEEETCYRFCEIYGDHIS